MILFIYCQILALCDETILNTLENYIQDLDNSFVISRIIDIAPQIPVDQIPKIEKVNRNTKTIININFPT